MKTDSFGTSAPATAIASIAGSAPGTFGPDRQNLEATVTESRKHGVTGQDPGGDTVTAALSINSRLTSLAGYGVRAVPFSLLAGHFAPVLTYHAAFRNRPHTVSPLDNVSPDTIYAQLSELKGRFRFVSIDEYSEARSVRGLAAVTFDDGYKCVIEEALPVFESLGIPITIFVNASSLDRKPFWRHKVVQIINLGLVPECETSFHNVRKIAGFSFYEYLKDPRNNSKTVECEIDSFLKARNIQPGEERWLFDDYSCLISHPLVSYGNHTTNHYVLSSLSFDEQLSEIQTGLEKLKKFADIRLSGVLSVPFGQAQHVNRDTFTIMQDLGYKTLALNRNRLASGAGMRQEIKVIERFSPSGSSITWQCKKYWLKQPLRRTDPPVDHPRNSRSGMRVLELIDTLDTGGAEKMVSSLALKLAANGNSVHAVCLRDKGAMPISEERFRREGVALVELNKPDGFNAKVLWKLAAYAREYKIDVIHTHNPLVHHYGVAAGRIAGVPVILNTLHGISTLKMPGWARQLFKVSCFAGDHVVHVTAAVREAFLKEGYHRGDGNQTVIPNGIEFASLLGIQPRRSDGHFVFGTIGRLDRVKDQASLLRAFAMVQADDAACRLEILGSGELEQELRSLCVALGISGRVTFHGWSPDIESFLRRIDLFVLSSRSEGLPLTLLESMAAGLPVVATRVGGIPEVLERANSGWLCPPEDPAALAEAMRIARSATDLMERGKQSRRDVVLHHSIEGMTDRYAGLFEKLLRNRRGNAPRT